MKTKVPADLATLKAGKLVDLLYTVRQERLAFEREAAEVKEVETRISNYLLDNMTKEDLSRLSGDIANVKVMKSVVPTVTDWEAFYAYVKKKGAFDLLQRRTGIEAFRERWEQGIEIPGVTQFTNVGLSVTKTGKKEE